MKKRKKKEGEPDWYFKSIWKSGKKEYISYPFANGQKEYYEKICLSIPHWCGVPTDVDWAMTTNSFREAEEQFKNNNNN